MSHLARPHHGPARAPRYPDWSAVLRWNLVPIALLGLLVGACHSRPESERAPVDECGTYLDTYGSCLRKSGLKEDQITQRLVSAQGAMFHAADQGEAQLEALRSRCTTAAHLLERSCR